MAKKTKTVIVNDDVQKNYKYTLTEPIGKNFDPEFTPQLTPKQMLKLGVFGGLYFTGKEKEFPKDWFEGVELSTDGHIAELNFFNINASQSLKVWQEKGWIYKDDPRGWFQWYCRYYMGRRLPEEDQRQIKRWKAVKRHLAQLVKNCKPGDFNCRPKQRQALLHWAYDTRYV